MTAVQQVPPTPLHPLSVEGASSFGTCGNCGAPLAGPFCSQCGEKRLSAADYSIQSVAHEVAEDFAHFDSKILRTLKALLTSPGTLTKVYFAGGRSRYTKPLTLFVVLNIVFFFVQPHTGLLSYKYDQYLIKGSRGREGRIELVRNKLIANREQESAYRIRFNERLQEQKKSLLIVSVPMLALVMSALYFRRGRYYVEHLVFSIHTYAFLLIALLLAAAIIMAAVTALLAIFGQPALHLARSIESEAGISLILGTALITYLSLGLRRAFGDRLVPSLIRAAVMTSAIMIFTGFYHDLLFYATYYTT